MRQATRRYTNSPSRGFPLSKLAFFVAVTATALVALIGGGCAAKAEPEPVGWDRVTGQTWSVQTVGGRPAIETLDARLTFQPDGTFNGDTGVNRVFGKYNVTSPEDGRGTLRLPVISAQELFRDDPEGAMAQESAILQALRQVDGWRLDSGNLLLVSIDDTVLRLSPTSTTTDSRRPR